MKKPCIFCRALFFNAGISGVIAVEIIRGAIIIGIREGNVALVVYDDLIAGGRVILVVIRIQVIYEPEE
jgi:hypothetical protein